VGKELVQGSKNREKGTGIRESGIRNVVSFNPKLG
jgi:hypothetical protein